MLTFSSIVQYAVRITSLFLAPISVLFLNSASGDQDFQRVGDGNMPYFRIERSLENQSEHDERGREIHKLKLDDEWTIICGTFLQANWNAPDSRCVDSIKIVRKNTVGEFLVSGELKFMERNTVFLLMNVSHFIKTGSYFTEICSGLASERFTYFTCSVFGYMDIVAAKEKQPTALANEESKQRIQLNSFEELSNNFERLLNPDPSCFADVTLKCDSVSIPAHKIILSARSPVFAAMFAHPMKESLGNEVEVTDVDVSTLRDLLKYVYTGKTSDMTASSAADLLFAADKYQLPDLKAVCAYSLKATMSVENMWKILVLGDMHSEDLKSFAVEYICKKCADFSVLENSEEWKALRKERSGLAIELLESLVKYRDGKQRR